MKKVMLRGALNILPLALTIWIFWSISVSLDDFGAALLILVGFSDPWPGVGFFVIFGIILGTGLAFSVSPIMWLYQRIERQLLRFPFFKTVYGAIKDLASLVSSDDEAATQRQTVLMKHANGTYTVGFVTADKLPEVVSKALTQGDRKKAEDSVEDDADEWVPVLLQLSYQVAGVTSLVRRSELIYVDWPFEEAMRFMLTAGISQTGSDS